MDADWISLAFIFTVIGFLLVVLAIAGASHELTGADGAVESLEISGFLAFLLTFILTSLIKYGQLDNDREINIANVAFSFLTALLVVVGLIVYGCKVSRKPPPYTTTLLVCGALMAAMGGIFSLMEIMD